jgi:integrase
MAETGIEAQELHNITQDQINKETGTLTVIGTKLHNNGTYKLNEKLANDLRKYLATHQNNQPFPESRKLGEAWVNKRANRAKELNKPELLKIPMKNLRNYAGAIYYTTMGKDPIATKNFMRHKRLEQTMDYLRGLTEFTAKSQKIGKIVNTAEEAMQLILEGFKEEAVFNQGTPNEKHILTKINI